MPNPFEVFTSFNSNNKNKPLDWEESAADLGSHVEEVFDADRTKPQTKWLTTLISLVFFIIVVRLINLQIIQGQSFKILSETNRLRSQNILAPRGKILDRNLKVLAQNTASFNLVVIPADLPRENLEQTTNKLTNLLNLQESELQLKLKAITGKSLNPIIVEQDITDQQSILFETHANEFLGFTIQKNPIRDYIKPLVFSHVLGYTGLVSAEDLKNLNPEIYSSVDYTGKSGIEQSYENFLHGENGENQIEIDATGKLINALGEKSPVPGKTLVLNIDKELQEKLFGSLTKYNLNTKAAAVAINPKNGEVLALLSLPGFDNNLFAHGIKSSDYNKLLQDKNLPLFNRSISGTYPPGSTVKPMVAASALQEGIITNSSVVNDTGSITIANQFDSSISYKFLGWKLSGLGLMNVYSAIAQSSDIFFYVVAGGHPSSKIKGLGAEKLAEYYKKFNLGKILGIDVAGEKPGLVPTPDWKAEYFKNDPVMSKWYLGDTYHIGIGQGDLLVTPLQVAEWTATIANNGVGFKPQIVNKILGNDEKIFWQNKPEILINRFIDLTNIKIVQDGMRQTVLSGSGRALSTLPISSAGKTGTSQFDGADPSRTHAWFTAYAPFENPQIVISVLVEAGGEGHTAAVPVAKDALEWWAKNRYKKVTPH